MRIGILLSRLTSASGWGVVAGLILLAGCGGGEGLKTYPARGTVAFEDGTPVTGGVVEFQPVEGGNKGSARGDIQADGTFVLTTTKPEDGAVAGEHQAIVIPPPPALPDGNEPGGSNQLPASEIDPKFQSFETSGLKFTVSENAEENDFEVIVEKPKG